MYKYIYIALTLALFGLASCQSHQHSQAHQKAVDMTEKMRLIHQSLLDDFAQTQNEQTKLHQKLQQTEAPDAAAMEMLKQRDAQIADIEGRLTQQKELLAQHQAYISAHESTALTATEITAQHERMRQNYEQIRQDSASIASILDAFQQDSYTYSSSITSHTSK